MEGGGNSSGKDRHFKEKPGSQRGGIMVTWDKRLHCEVAKGPESASGWGLVTPKRIELKEDWMRGRHTHWSLIQGGHPAPVLSLPPHFLYSLLVPREPDDGISTHEAKLSSGVPPGQHHFSCETPSTPLTQTQTLALSLTPLQTPFLYCYRVSKGHSVAYPMLRHAQNHLDVHRTT